MTIEKSEEAMSLMKTVFDLANDKPVLLTGRPAVGNKKQTISLWYIMCLT